MNEDAPNEVEQPEQKDNTSSNPTGIEIEEELREQLSPTIDEVEQHDVFEHIETIGDARLFLEYYCFAAWDFQIHAEAFRRPEEAPRPSYCPGEMKRPLEGIELTDRIAYVPEYRGYLSPTHSLVTRVMEHIGADLLGLRGLIQNIEDGVSLDVAIQQNTVPPEARYHIRTTWTIAQSQNLPRIVGALALGRRDIIPLEFAKQMKDQHIDASPHRIEGKGMYIDVARGVEVDNLLHVDRLLSDPRLGELDSWREEALQGASTMLEARREFLNGIRDKVQENDPSKRWRPWGGEE
jgi:hypothetical protein